MNHTLEVIVLVRRATLLLGLGIAAAHLAAQPKLEITSPKDGDTVYSGRILNVRVAASPAGTFRAVGLLVGSPLECGQVRTAPPYEFLVRIPPDVASQRYSLVAMGLIAPGKGADSESISIKVERPDSPQKLKAEPSMLLFDYLGQEGQSRVYGSFEDGSEVDLTYSSLLTYTSEEPNVATVDRNGEVTGVAPGRTKITIRYKEKTIRVPVEVPNKKRPEGAIPDRSGGRSNHKGGVL